MIVGFMAAGGLANCQMCVSYSIRILCLVCLVHLETQKRKKLQVSCLFVIIVASYQLIGLKLRF